MRNILRLALVLSLAACSGATDPAPSLDATLESTLISGSTGDPNGLVASADVQVVAGNLRVTGIVPTPTPCLELRGTVALVGTTARVRITAFTGMFECFALPSGFSYRLESRVPAGVTRVVVEHELVLRSQTQSLTVVRDTPVAPQ